MGVKKIKHTNAHIFACTHTRTYAYANTHMQARTGAHIDTVTQLYTHKGTHIHKDWQKPTSTKTKSVYQNKL